MKVFPGDVVKFVRAYTHKGSSVMPGTLGIVEWFDCYAKFDGVIVVMGIGAVYTQGTPFEVVWTPKREKARP